MFLYDEPSSSNWLTTFTTILVKSVSALMINLRFEENGDVDVLHLQFVPRMVVAFGHEFYLRHPKPIRKERDRHHDGVSQRNRIIIIIIVPLLSRSRSDNRIVEVAAALLHIILNVITIITIVACTHARAKRGAGTLVGRSKRTRSAVATNRKVRSQSSRSPSSSSSTSAADTRRRRRRPTLYRPTKKDVNLDPKVYFGSSCARTRKPLHDAAPTIFRALDTERDGGVSKRNPLVDFKRRSRVHRTHCNSEFEKKK
ncbi:hypothetical protein AGLY_010168 [Aphis glycines]|uniref:Uncharacterized protein n=1 Tax=Aphis glycines TaxID=307491 RepID=A0A6G0TF72_APHGL|nr:hypothetical protein AGLY_010168 [Aphis glycines]